MPTPLGEAAQMRNPLLSDLCREHRAKPVPPKTDGLMADVDPALGREILDVSQRKWYWTYIVTTRRITSGELLKYRNGLRMAQSHHGRGRPEELP
jgi:hypothetical protein